MSFSCFSLFSFTPFEPKHLLSKEVLLGKGSEISGKLYKHSKTFETSCLLLFPHFGITAEWKGFHAASAPQYSWEFPNQNLESLRKHPRSKFWKFCPEHGWKALSPGNRKTLTSQSSSRTALPQYGWVPFFLLLGCPLHEPTRARLDTLAVPRASLIMLASAPLVLFESAQHLEEAAVSHIASMVSLVSWRCSRGIDPSQVGLDSVLPQTITIKIAELTLDCANVR